MSFDYLPKVRNNSVIIFSAQTFSLILNIISISLAARYLGVDDFGKFNYLLAVVGIGAKVFDFGFNPIIFRELSKKNNGGFLGSVLIFRTTIIVLIVALVSLIGILINYDLLKLSLILILSINVLFSNKFTNLRELITIPFKVNLKMYIPMGSLILDNILLLLFVLLMPFFNGGMIYFVSVYVISNIPGMLILYYLLLNNYKFNYKLDINEIKFLFNESFPLIGFIIFSFLYTILDVLVLEYIKDSSSVGIYSSALRLVVPLKLIPNIFVITLFSIIVNNIGNEKYNDQITNFVTKLFFLFTILFSGFMFIGSKEVILIIFGHKYIDAEIPLKILSLNIFFDFFSFFILDLFTAYGKQKYNFQFIIIVTISLLLANLLLVPNYDFVGASFSRVISGMLGFLFLLYILVTKIKIILNFFSLGLIVSAICFIFTLYFLKDIYPFINIIISAFCFTAMIIFLKVFSKNEIKIITKLFGNNWMIGKLKKYYKL